MSEVRIPTIRVFRVAGFRPSAFYSPSHLPIRHESMTVLSLPSHPLRPKMIETFANTPPKVFDWSVNADASVKLLPKAILRSKLRDRWKRAFRAALLRAGYAADGGNLISTRATKGLTGRLHISVNEAHGFGDTDDKLIEECTVLITALEGSGRNQVGRTISPTHHKSSA